LDPALPISESLVDKLFVVVGGEIGRVTLEALHNKFTLFGSEKRGGGWRLKDGSVTFPQESILALTSHMYQNAMNATTTVSRPSMRN
jgi:hypothetical protein